MISVEVDVYRMPYTHVISVWFRELQESGPGNSDQS